jgi:tetratricopeptide (TPR) repeat protein
MESLERSPANKSERISPVEKITLATPLKERGNMLYREQRYAEAKRSYDEAFVHMFCTQEEFDYEFTAEEKQKHQQFLVMLHLNRGLCKLKLKDLEAAKWDFDEAVRYTKNLPEVGSKIRSKALYRRALTLIEMARIELQKDEQREYWDEEKVLDWCISSERDLREAMTTESKERAIHCAMQSLHELRARLSKLQRAQRARSKEFFSKLGIYRKITQRDPLPICGTEKAQTAHQPNVDHTPDDEQENLQNLPDLERVRIY